LHPAGCSLLHDRCVRRGQAGHPRFNCTLQGARCCTLTASLWMHLVFVVSIAPCRVLAVALLTRYGFGTGPREFQLHPAGCSLLHDSLTKQRLAASNVSIAPCRVLAVALSAMA